MSLSLSWLLWNLAAAPEAAPAAAAPAEAPAPAAAPSDPEARAEQAAALYQQKKYAEAAQMLEDLWEQVHEPRDLFNAGLARLAMGHRGHAIRYWEQYLQQPNIPEDGREQAVQRIKKAQGMVAGVVVRVAPSAVVEVGVTMLLSRLDPNDRDRRPDLILELPPGAPEFTSGGKTLHLDPGKWQLKVSARGYVTATRDLMIKPGNLAGFPLEVVLAQDPSLRTASFQVEPEAALTAGATVTLQRLALNAEPLPCPLDGAGKCSVRIEPGDWEVTVQAPGYQRYVEKISLGAQPNATFAVALAPTLAAAVPGPGPVPPADKAAPPTPAGPEGPAKAEPAVPETVPKKTRIQMSAGLISAGIPIFITGLALAVYGSNQYDDRKLTKTTNADLLPPIRTRAAGTGLMGAAVGLWTAGLTAEYDVKPWVWWTEIGVGGASLLAGAVWAGVTTARWNAMDVGRLYCNNNADVDCFVSHRMGAGFFLGLGTSMLAGATTGLLVRRHFASKGPRRTSLAPYFGAAQAGFVLQGRF